MSDVARPRARPRVSRRVIGVAVSGPRGQGGPGRKNYFGKAVAPSTPREEAGLYWGYQTRLASGIAEVLSGCPFKGG